MAAKLCCLVCGFETRILATKFVSHWPGCLLLKLTNFATTQTYTKDKAAHFLFQSQPGWQKLLGPGNAQVPEAAVHHRLFEDYLLHTGEAP